MKDRLLLLATLFAAALPAAAQNANFKIKDGTKYTIEIKSYPNMLAMDQKFLKAKPEKRSEQVEARNADILAGKTPVTPYPMVYKVTKEPNTPKGEEYKSTTNIAGKEYSSYYLVTPDSLFLIRNKGFVPLDLGGENYGFTIQGIERIPFNIKVGDKLPVYEDLGIIYPKTSTQKVQEWVETARGDEWVLYNRIDVDVKRTVSMNSHVINNVNAQVTRSENIEVNGKTYTAYVIESESWTKTGTTTTIEASNKESEMARQRFQQKMEEKNAKKMVKEGMVNPDGYMVTSKEEWFVPELGVVRMRTYDMYGAITADIDVKVE